MRKKLFSILALLLIMAAAIGPARAQNTQTRTLTGIPQGWSVTANGESVTANADGSYTIAAGAAVKLIPPAEVKPTVQNLTVSKAEQPVTLATPLTMEALTAGTIKVNSPKNGMKYKKNDEEIVVLGSTTTEITVAAGDKVAFFGDGTNITKYNTTGIYGGTATVKVYGNIMSLIDEENFATATMLPNTSVFRYFFQTNYKLTDASGLLLPATTLTSQCYYGMFQSDTNLTTAPVLPATTLASQCYTYMFAGCRNLTAAPALPATELASNCYDNMFASCRNLTAAPTLPATQLANYCYQRMFQGCTSLTAAPALPATTLATGCYYNMFRGCTSLNSITCLATNLGATNTTSNWLNGVATSGTFTKAANANWEEGASGIPSGWNVVDAQ